MPATKPNLRIGRLSLPTPVLLAPMAGYTDLPFRLGIRSLGGVGMAYTEMLNPRSLLFGRGPRRDAMLATSPGDRPLGYQMYGNDPSLLAEAARWLAERGAELIDLNMGCPQRKIAAAGSGAGLLKDPAAAVTLAEKVVQSVAIPVTAKLRLGWTADRPVATRLARDLEQAGIAAIAVHGRTGGQRYAGRADWDGIREVVEAVSCIPVVGNGDVTSAASARDLFRHTGCAAILVGRGVLRNPWLIREIWDDMRGAGRVAPPAVRGLQGFLLDHFDRHMAHYGDRAGVALFRKWIAQYVRGFGIRREQMGGLMRITRADDMRAAFRAFPLAPPTP
jgi:nifR3 family TIM-barrel protein